MKATLREEEVSGWDSLGSSLKIWWTVLTLLWGRGQGLVGTGAGPPKMEARDKNLHKVALKASLPTKLVQNTSI